MAGRNWTKVFSSLPEPVFFAVVRHYLGPVQTPFHKPSIIQKMANFLNQEDVLSQSIDYIDKMDALVLSCIDLYDFPTEANLEKLIPSMRNLMLREKLLNFEERLLIWRQAKNNRYKFSLTPLGEYVRETGILGAGNILGSSTGELCQNIAPWYDDNFLNSALSFLSENTSLFRKEGGWRKKTLLTLQERFPLLFHDEYGTERLLLAGRGLLATGLAVKRKRKLAINLSTWRKMEQKTQQERRIIMLSWAAVGQGIPIESAIVLTRTLLECLPKNCAYAEENLISLIQITVGGEHPISQKRVRSILFHMELLGELSRGKNGGFGRPSMPKEYDSSVLSITPVGDIACHPGMPLCCELALSTKAISVDVVTTYQIDKARFIAGLDTGVDIKKLIEKLERYSHGSLPKNIVILFKEWNDEYYSVSLNLAAVLQVKGSQQRTIDETHVLDPFTIEKPAPNIWLLDARYEKEWREALARIGLTSLPSLRRFDQFSLMEKEKPSSSLPQLSYLPSPPFSNAVWNIPDFNEKAPDLKKYTENAAFQKLDEKEKTVFLERLERRLILSPQQIRSKIWRYEVMTAKGLDYRGKLLLIEAALIGRNERLELTVAEGNDIKTRTLIPESLEKEGTGHILVGKILPEEEIARYAVRKIAFLKRIKTSLF